MEYGQRIKKIKHKSLSYFVSQVSVTLHTLVTTHDIVILKKRMGKKNVFQNQSDY